MTAKHNLRSAILFWGLGLVLTGMGVSAIACQPSPNSPQVDNFGKLPQTPFNPGESKNNPVPLPQPQGNGDYQRSPHFSWETTDLKTQGIECRMLENTTYEKLEDPKNKTELNIGNWPVVGNLKPGQDFEINLGPAGFGIVYDTKHQPWMYVEKTDEAGAPSRCFVRANQRFVQPISPQ